MKTNLPKPPLGLLKSLLVIALVAYALTGTGCRSMAGGTRQQVGLSARPPVGMVVTEPKLYVDDVFRGILPMEIDLPKRKDAIITIVADGYETVRIQLSSKWSGGRTTIGVLEGFYGLPLVASSIVDASTGAYKVLRTPDGRTSVGIVLQPAQAASQYPNPYPNPANPYEPPLVKPAPTATTNADTRQDHIGELRRRPRP